MAVVDKVVGIQQLLTDIRVEHDEEVSEYVREISYLNSVCDGQTLELQRLNLLLERKNEEIKRLREGV